MSSRPYFLAIPLVLLMGLSTPAQADFDSALKAYEEKNYPAALKEFQALAELGEQSAQFNLGVMYYKGEGVVRDPIRAYAWLSLASESVEGDAPKIRDSVFRKLDDRQKAEAKTLSQEYFARFGRQAIQSELLPVLADNASYWAPSKAVKKVAPEYPYQAAEAGVGGVVVIEFRIDGGGNARDPKVLLSLPRKIFDKPALLALRKWKFMPPEKGQERFWRRVVMEFKLQKDQKSIVRDEKLAELKALVEQGNHEAQYQYARALLLPEIGETAKETPLVLLTKAAQGGVADAQYELGKNMLMGAGCKSDIGKGAAWLRLAAQAGKSDAQYDLSQVLLHHPAYIHEQEKARRWLEQAAAAGHALAKRDLAWLLATGTELKARDAHRALQLMKEAAVDADEPESLEVLAAVHAELGQFAKAVSYQEKAMDEAEDQGWDLQSMKARLAAYESNKPWRE